MNGIILSLIKLLIQKELLILEEGSSIELLCAEMLEKLEENDAIVSLGTWLGTSLLHSPHVAELFASDKELGSLILEL